MEPEKLTLKSNLNKVKRLRYKTPNDISVKSAVIDKAAYLLPTLIMQPYITITREGNIGLEYGREDGSFLNFYIYDEPKIHMVVTLKSHDGRDMFVRTTIDPNECNKRITDFYNVAS